MSGRQNPAIPEIFEPPESYLPKVKTLASMIKNSKHMIAFTGGKFCQFSRLWIDCLTFSAGISTSANIPDYRSAVDTKISSGPGTWNYEGEKL